MHTTLDNCTNIYDPEKLGHDERFEEIYLTFKVPSCIATGSNSFIVGVL